jgi:curved DNA-binding protein CbpA
MARDPYKILGVSRDADDEQIRRAYRRLAKQEHPDAEGGDEDYFCRLNDAYEQLRTPERRREYKRREERERHASARGRGGSAEDWARDLRRGAPERQQAFAGSIFDAFERMFERAMGAGFGGYRHGSGAGGERRSGAGRSFEASVRLSPREAARGITLEVELPDGRRQLEVPAGVNDGDVLSYRELDENGRPVGVELAVYVD